METTEQNKDLIREIIDEAFNGGNFDRVPEWFVPDYVAHVPGVPGLPSGPQAFTLVITMWRAAFADLHMTIEDLVAEGDKVANRFTTTGTHTGDLFGVPATGKTFTVGSQEVHRIVDGRVVESWVCNDVPLIFQQLGITQNPAGVAAPGWVGGDD